MRNFENQMSRAAAKTLVTSLSCLHADHFVSNRVSDKLIAVMAKLNLTEQHSLVDRAKHFLEIKIDESALQRQLSELESLREEQELEDTFLLQGAPLVLMRRLFGMHASEFSRRRNSLNIKGVASGRPPQCDEKMEHLVWEQWQANEHLNDRQRFLAVAEITSVDLHIIWAALRDHIDR